MADLIDISLAAGVHFGCSLRTIQYAGLDSPWDFERDVARGEARFEDGYLYPLERPGYGLEVGEGFVQEMARIGRKEVGQCPDLSRSYGGSWLRFAAPERNSC